MCKVTATVKFNFRRGLCMTNEGLNNNLDVLKRVGVLFFVVAFFSIILPNAAFADAAQGGGIETVLCNVVNQLQGGIGKAIATIGIIVLGIGLFTGKLAWPLAIATAIGIGMIFGAASIVDWVSAGTGETGGSSCAPNS